MHFVAEPRGLLQVSALDKTAFSSRKKEKTMPDFPDAPSGPERWAHFRFSIVGPLLAAPPKRGELGAELDRLAAKSWRCPASGQWVRCARSTIERWYYQALREKRDPVGALMRKTRADRGTWPSMSPAIIDALKCQWRSHPDWSYKLHADNLAVVAAQKPEMGPMPSYRTLLRFMRAQGLRKRRRSGPPNSPGAQRAQARLEAREVRSYESPYTNALWHLDYHHGSVRVLLRNGTWIYPLLLGVLDDHSRLCCHCQWYQAETAENLVHGLSQAILKRGLPRALMSDNGSAMLAGETTQGLERLGIVHETTLPYSPYQNGKQESFWGQVEGRLLAMMGSSPDLTLEALNEATQAWVEMEYNRSLHSQLGTSPVQRFVNDKDAGRPAPPPEQLKLAFTARLGRTQRTSDGTVSVFGKRFEIPARYNHLPHICLRAASWDLSHLHLCDPSTGAVLAKVYPQDKAKNADARRRTKPAAPASTSAAAQPQPQASQPMAPLLRKLIADYAATGLPPAYIPKDPPQEI
jgi:putative transposase